MNYTDLKDKSVADLTAMLKEKKLSCLHSMQSRRLCN